MEHGSVSSTHPGEGVPRPYAGGVEDVVEVAQINWRLVLETMNRHVEHQEVADITGYECCSVANGVGCHYDVREAQRPSLARKLISIRTCQRRCLQVYVPKIQIGHKPVRRVPLVGTKA